MQKSIYLLILEITLSTSTFAATTWDETNCSTDKGIIVSVGGDSFCRAKNLMNWWSGFTWCQKIGGHMPSIQELCPGKNITKSADCGRSYGLSYIWSTTPLDGYTDAMWQVANNKIWGGPLENYRSHSRYIFCLKD